MKKKAVHQKTDAAIEHHKAAHQKTDAAIKKAASATTRQTRNKKRDHQKTDAAIEHHKKAQQETDAAIEHLKKDAAVHGGHDEQEREEKEREKERARKDLYDKLANGGHYEEERRIRREKEDEKERKRMRELRHGVHHDAIECATDGSECLEGNTCKKINNKKGPYIAEDAVSCSSSKQPPFTASKPPVSWVGDVDGTEEAALEQ